MLNFSTEYFIPTKLYPHGIPLNCTENNSNMTDGKIVVSNEWNKASKFHDLIVLIINFIGSIICTT